MTCTDTDNYVNVLSTIKKRKKSIFLIWDIAGYT